MVTSFSESFAEIFWKFRQKHSCESRNFSTHQGVIYPHSPTWYKDAQTHFSAAWALWLRLRRRPNSELIYLQLLPESIHDGEKWVFLLPFGLYGKELVNWKKFELVTTYCGDNLGLLLQILYWQCHVIYDKKNWASFRYKSASLRRKIMLAESQWSSILKRF